jgi:hypothetical protein
MLGEQRRHAGAIGKLKPDEAKGFLLPELVEARLLERRIVIGIEVVEPDDGAAAGGEAAREPMKPAAPVTRMGSVNIGVAAPSTDATGRRLPACRRDRAYP